VVSKQVRYHLTEHLNRQYILAEDQNEVLGVHFTPDKDMDLIDYRSISEADFQKAEYENYQRSPGDLPDRTNDYLVLFSSVKLEFGAIILKEVTCRIVKSSRTDEEYMSSFEGDWQEAGTGDFQGRQAMCYTINDEYPIMQFFTEAFDGYRLAGTVRGESIGEVERLANKLFKGSG